MPYKTELNFLVDTGAAVSLILIGILNISNMHNSVVKLTTADGNYLKVFGETFLELTNRKLRRSFRWNFVVAAVTKPILGADFLAHFDIQVDCKNQTLIDGTTGVSVITHISERDPTQVTPILKINGSVSLEVQELLSKYPQFKPAKVNSQAVGKSGQVTSHHIPTNSDVPVFAKPRQLAADKLEVAKNEFKDLLADGIIRPSSSHGHHLYIWFDDPYSIIVV